MIKLPEKNMNYSEEIVCGIKNVTKKSLLIKLYTEEAFKK